MANPIGQVVAAIASLIVLLIAYTIFGPMIDGVLSGLVYEAIANPGNTALATNANSLGLTVKIIQMGFKIFAFFVIGAIIFRMIVYLGWFTEEQGVY